MVAPADVDGRRRSAPLLGHRRAHDGGGGADQRDAERRLIRIRAARCKTAGEDQRVLHGFKRFARDRVDVFARNRGERGRGHNRKRPDS